MPYFQSSAQTSAQPSNGAKVFYEQCGESGPVVVFIHGLGSTGRLWLSQTHAIAKHFKVFTLDLPGHGQSDRLSSYRFSHLADLLALFLDDRQIQKVILVGLSLGCTIALTFAVLYPDRVTALVLESPLGGFHPWYHPLGFVDALVLLTMSFTLPLIISIFGYQATAYWINFFNIKRKRSLKILESVQSEVDFRAVHQLLYQSIRPPYIGKLENIKVPVLLIRGEKDPLPERFTQYIQTHIPHAQLLHVPDTHHLVSIEKPHHFNQILKEFLSTLPSES